MTSEVVTAEDEATHPNVVFRPNEQGAVAMMRAMVGFGVRKRKE